jgi:YfiH family protein
LVQENRARMAANLGVAPERFLSLYQIHSPDVITVTTPWPNAERPRADAMVTREKGIALGIGTADCGPILFADAEAGVIGAAHSGWKGAIGGVLESTLDAMEALGASRNRIAVALGPMLSQTNYEVGPEFQATFLAESAGNARFFMPGTRPDIRISICPAISRRALNARAFARLRTSRSAPMPMRCASIPIAGRSIAAKRIMAG